VCISALLFIELHPCLQDNIYLNSHRISKVTLASGIVRKFSLSTSICRGIRNKDMWSIYRIVCWYAHRHLSIKTYSKYAAQPTDGVVSIVEAYEWSLKNPTSVLMLEMDYVSNLLLNYQASNVYGILKLELNPACHPIFNWAEVLR